jgi:hypothetical protein
MARRRRAADPSRMASRRNVNRVEPPAARKTAGMRILIASLTVGGVGIAPLLLYILLGPADGNPIGLGLLAVLAVAVALIGGLIGAVTLGVEYLRRPRS